MSLFQIFTIILPQNRRLILDSKSVNAQIIKWVCRAVKILVPLAKSEPYYGELIEKFLNQCREGLDPVSLLLLIRFSKLPKIELKFDYLLFRPFFTKVYFRRKIF